MALGSQVRSCKTRLLLRCVLLRVVDGYIQSSDTNHLKHLFQDSILEFRNWALWTEQKNSDRLPLAQESQAKLPEPSVSWWMQVEKDWSNHVGGHMHGQLAMQWPALSTHRRGEKKNVRADYCNSWAYVQEHIKSATINPSPSRLPAGKKPRHKPSPEAWVLCWLGFISADERSGLGVYCSLKGFKIRTSSADSPHNAINDASISIIFKRILQKGEDKKYGTPKKAPWVKEQREKACLEYEF